MQTKDIQDEISYRLGKTLINQFNILLKTAQIHDPKNGVWEQPINNIFNVIEDLFRISPEVSLVMERDCLYLGETKLKMDIKCFESFMTVMEEMQKRQVGTIQLLKEVTREQLKKFIYVFVHTNLKIEDPFEVLATQLKGGEFEGVHIERLIDKKPKKETEVVQKDKKEVGKKTYYKTISIVTEVMENVKLGQMNVKKAKRVVHSMVDMIIQDESTLLGLTTLRGHDEYTHNHSVNVCILSLSMGQRLGYHKRALSELGMAALFHDIGKTNIPLEVLNKPTDFNEEDWKIMREHPILGVEKLIEIKGLHESSLFGAIGAFEHHLNYDLSGYPPLVEKRELTMLGRIIGIVDCYDALTSSRVYSRTAFSPENALKLMLSKSGTALDPTLLKIFVNCIGFYPIGTMVLLKTHEVGVVVGNPINPQNAARPKVKVVADSEGRQMDGPTLDLSDDDAAQWEILTTIDSTKLNIDVSQYFV